MGNIFIVAEHSQGKPKKYSIELAGKAKTLGSAEIVALMFGEGAEQAAKELGQYGVKKVLIASHTSLQKYNSESYTKILCDAIAQEKPSVVLGSASIFGKDLFARAAMRLGKGLATDCIELSMEEGKLKATRPLFSGKARVDVIPQGEPQMATARPNSFPIPQAGSGEAEIVSFSSDPGTSRTRVVEEKEAEGGMVDLTEADRIVSGGRSLASAENFKMIRELAESIGASVGASRAAVDAGYISHDHQVGQTGKTVNPSLYIACGISGAIQHLAGMRTAKVVVAINKDPDSPIFSKCDYGIVGDLFEIVPALTEEFKKLLRE